MMGGVERELAVPDRAVPGVATLSAVASSDSVRSALSRLLTMLVAALAFVVGLLLPDLRGAESLGPAWLAVPGLLSVLVLPLLAFGTAVGALHRLLDRRSNARWPAGWRSASWRSPRRLSCSTSRPGASRLCAGPPGCSTEAPSTSSANGASVCSPGTPRA